MKTVFSVLKLQTAKYLVSSIRISGIPHVIIFAVFYFSVTLCLSEFTTTLTFQSSKQHIVKILVLTHLLRILVVV